MEIKHSHIFNFIAIVIIYSLTPVISRIWSTYLTTYSYMLLIGLILLFIILGRGQEILNHYAWVLAPFVGWCIMQYFVRTESIVMYGYQQMIFVLPIAVGTFLHEDGELRYETKLHKIILLCLCVTAVTTVIGLYRFPDAARWLATADSSSNAQLVQYDWRNIGGFDFVYTLLLIYPAVIFRYKKQRIRTVPFVLIAVLIAVALYEAEYTTAILLFLISSALLFFKKELRGRGLLIFAVIAVLVCLLLSDYVSNFLSWLGGLLGGDNYTERLNALAGGTQGLMASEDDRIFRYMKSWNTFLFHPFLGTFLSGSGGIGGHSFILDALGQFGLVGGGLLFFMYKRIYQIFYQPFKECEGYGYMLWAFIQTVLLSAINTGMWLPVLCIYIPVMCRTVFLQEEMQRIDETSGVEEMEGVNGNIMDHQYGNRYIR